MNLKKIFKYYWHSAKRFSPFFIGMLFSYAFAAICASVLSPIVIKNLIDTISNNEFSSGVYVTQSLYKFVFQFSVLAIASYAGYRIGDYLIIRFSSQSIRAIHNDTFARIIKHSYKFFANNFSGSLVAKTKRFGTSFDKLVDIVSYSFWFAFVQIVAIFIVLFREAPQIGWMFVAWLVVDSLMIVYFIRKKIKYDLEEANADSKVTGAFADSITNILNLKIFSSSIFENNRFEKVTEEEYDKRNKAWLLGHRQHLTQALSIRILQIGVLVFMVKLWLAGAITAGMLVLVQTFTMQLSNIMRDLSKAFVRFMKEISNAQELVDIFEQPLEILDPVNPEKLSVKDGGIVFKDVSFSYTEDVEVFSNLNMEIKAKEKVGLVGHSGSGKSTITKVLLRFMDINRGEVLIDGQNITKITQDDLRSVISYVPQEPILFHRSIYENIAYSNPKATLDQVIEVAKKAHAHEFISKLKKGYDTLVGERGVKLSGGERQRIAIARAMLKKSPIIVLDEATSALDSVSESYIQDAFNQLMQDKTAIVIAHRLSTIQKLDRIIVLDKGEVVEEGTHQELLSRNGVYAQMWNRQTGGFLED